jgi:hypothetical protein
LRANEFVIIIANMNAAPSGKATGTILLLLLAATGALHAAPPAAEDNFIFKFDVAHPLVYAIRSKIEMTTYMSAGGQTASPTTTKSATEVRYKIKLTAESPGKDGATLLHYEPFDYESDSEATGPSGHFVNTVRGLQVKGTQNGITVMDTEKEIGTSQAKAFKSDATLLLLSGKILFDEHGGAKEFHGDLPFVDFWKGIVKAQVGVFGVTFPDHPLAKGDSWDAIVPLKSIGQIKLEGDGLSYTNTFTRRDDSDWRGHHVAILELTAPLRCHDLTGYIEQGGQSTHLNVTEFERHATGTLHFDREHGTLIDNETTGTATSAMTTLVQGRALSMRMEMRIESEIKLLDDSGKAVNQPGSVRSSSTARSSL